MDRRLLPVLLLLSVVAAGCADAPRDDVVHLGDGQTINLEVPEGRRDDGFHGSLVGVVVDEAIFPVAGANVSFAGRPASTLTDRNGSFAFPAVPPGLHVLRVEAPGMLAAQATARVEPDGVARAILVLERMPTPPIYNTTVAHRVRAPPAWDVYADAGDWVPIGFDRAPDEVVLEAWFPDTWAPPEMLENLTDAFLFVTMEVRFPGEDGTTRYSGEAPLVVPLDNLHPRGLEVRTYPSAAHPVDPTDGLLVATVFYGSPAPEGWSVLGGGDT